MLNFNIINHLTHTGVRIAGHFLTISILIGVFMIIGCSGCNADMPNYKEYQKIFSNRNAEIEFLDHKIKRNTKFYNGKLLKEYYTYSNKNGMEIYHGPYSVYDENGIKRSEIFYINGIRDGYWFANDKKGNLIIQGIYRKDMPWEGQFWHPHSDKVVFTYKDGENIKYEDNGRVFAEGTWSNGKPWNGSFFNWDGNIEYYSDGKLLEKKKVEDVAMQFKYYRNKKETEDED